MSVSEGPLLCSKSKVLKKKAPFKIVFTSVICFFLFIYPGLNAKAQDSTSANQFEYNLDQCIDYALKHQNDVVNAKLNEDFANEQVLENKGKLLPHANINGSLIRNLKLATTLIPNTAGGNPGEKIPVQFGSKTTSAISGQINQTVFNSNYFLGLKAAKVFTELSTHNLDVTVVGTRVNVTKAYYNVLVTKEGIRISQSNLDQISKALKDVKAKYDAGIAETVDVNRIQVQYNNALTGIGNQQRLYELSLQQLKFQMGMPQNDHLELTQTVSDFTTEQVGNIDTSNFLLTDRPEIAVQQTQIALNELSLRSVKLSYLPELSAYLNYGRNYFSSSFADIYNRGFGNSALGLTLSFPIFQGTERTHQINEAKISLRQSQNDLDNLSQRIHLEVKDAYTQFINNNASLKTQKENMGLTQGVFDRIRYKFDQGVSSSLDLLSAENELQLAQSNYIDALLSTLMSRVDLEQALGKLGK
ncbi:MAG: TolC family protein [Chitinophagaceae bacterium]|nr:TolC family protein [Chitinophagaceae bacterium]